MAVPMESPLSHIDIPLPDPPSPEFFNETQWKVWYALMDTIVPSIVSTPRDGSNTDNYQITQSQLDAYYQEAQRKLSSPPSRKDFEAFLSEKPSDSQAFKDQITRTLASLPKDMRDQLGTMLSLLGTRLGSLPTTGYLTPFYDLPAEAREKVIKSWQTSYFTAFRGLAKSVSMLGQKTWVQSSQLFLQLSGWTDIPENYQAGKAADYTFKQFGPGAGPETIETDVVVVGSGCGGGVCAKVLAEAGHRVLVVDKGYYFSPAQLPMKSHIAEINLFESGGLMSVDDGSMSVLAGSTWGGGGSVNWGVSLQTPDYVRREWASKRGLDFFTSSDFQGSLDRVCEFMGVSDSAVRQNHRGQVLLDGAEKLGWKAKVTPHNSANKDHHCGHCHLGCGSAGKQGPAVSWLPAAARAGAEFIEGFQVERVTFDTFASGKKASGVVGKWISRDQEGGLTGSVTERVSRDVVIKAKRVVVSCGTLWSPVVLKNSGLANPQIGRNVYLHPVNLVGGFWKEDVKPWDGCAISSVCTAFEDLDGQGNGTKLEGVCMVPYLIYSNLPWRSGIDLKLSALRYRHLNAFFSMPRDRDTGYIYPDPVTGKPRIQYSPSAFDRANCMEGLVALARICYVQGAEEIRPFLSGVDSFIRSPSGEKTEAEDERFEQWLQTLRAAGNPGTEPWGGAHQMGSCRMSKSEEDGVVDPKGKVWGVEGLYVADASVFPTATGVNPMVTNMAISDSIARGIAADLGTLK
ncbi:hypothetical protein JX266_012329 [Neoarthrinium moseri]|nr:hypothetical protein JX266_012329 [Neoarthrinium moseri]